MLMNNNEYFDVVETIKRDIKSAQYRAVVSINRDLILLYYRIGQAINAHKSWGNKFIQNLAADIHVSFPNATGYSERNLKYMAKFAAAYPEEEFVQTVSAQIPWSHNIAIIEKVKPFEMREWYILKTAENGWSHSVLIHQIESRLYERQVIADKISNFENQLNFYLSAVDGIMKKDGDNPSIGLLLCKSKNNLVAEYALKDMTKPIGVSEYHITDTLPEALEKLLPSVEDLQKRI